MNYESSIDSSEASAFLAGDASEARASRRKMLLIAGAVLAALVTIWFLTHKGGGAAGADKKDQAPVVSVVAPGSSAIQGTINTTGTIGARIDMPVGSAGEGGQVLSVLVQPGDWVGQGQVLAVIDRRVQVQQQASSSAQISVAQADARLAQANLERALKLVDRGFISKADVDRLTATRDAANARVKVAGAQLGELQARTARLNIVAPAAGLVLERKVEPGQVVSAGSGMLFRIAKGGELELKADLSEMDLASIAPGTSAEVVPVGTDKTFIGEVWQLSPVINPQSRQGTAWIALRYAPELRPGGFASATIRAGTVVAPMLPESAILSDSQGSFVYIVGQNNKVERRKVKTGMITDKGIAIAEGLSGSERVVLRAGGFLQPGEAVQPRLSNAK